jgi:predicted HAD superfamily Cof-like phosphohydrolase
MKFNFADAIVAFNNMYKLPVAQAPTLNEVLPHVEGRLQAFKKILTEELAEIDLIIGKLEDKEFSDSDILTDLADLLGDIQVYCASEMAKFGIPLHQTLEIIMASNMSKLGADGLPIYDERGKVQKGPGYWKPEPKIKEMLECHIRDAKIA